MMKPIQDTINYLLVQVTRAQRSAIRCGLADLGLHAGQEMVLLHLWQEDGLTQSQLVERLCVEPPTVTKVLERMERAGLVQRCRDSRDARISRVYLTERGRKLETLVLERWDQVEQRAFKGFTAEECMLIRRLLLRMRQNLSGSA